MEPARFEHVLRTLIFACLILTLVLSALAHCLVFVINWEDWFFGVRLAGPAAGAFLFAKAAGATGVLILMAQYPRSQRIAAVAATIYFGILFLNSLVTFYGMAGYGYHHSNFPIIPPALFGLALAYLIIHCLAPETQAHREG